jgi:5'-methylthioadenosine phosphorylase
MQANAAKARETVRRLAAILAGTPREPSPIDTNLDFAIITPPEHRDPEMVAKLTVVAGRALR